MENKDTNDKQIYNKDVQKKLDEMRTFALSADKCKEIAQKLQAYIAKNS